MAAKSRTVLVTGGAGFIGSHLVDASLSAGSVREPLTIFAAGWRENVNPHAQHVEADLFVLPTNGRRFLFFMRGDHEW